MDNSGMTSECSPSMDHCDDYSEDEYDDFTDYMDEYIQKELDAQLQSQLDHQMDMHHQQIEDRLQRHLDDAIAEDARILSAKLLESENNRSNCRPLTSFLDDQGEEAEIRDMFLSMNLAQHSSDGITSTKEKTTVDDIDQAIRRIVDNIKKDD